MSGALKAVVVIISGIFTSMGMGGGSILIICLTFFGTCDQRIAQGIGLIFFIPVAAVAIIIYSKQKLIIWNITIPCAALGILGAIVGYCILCFVDPAILSKLFGLLLLIIGIFQWI